MNYVNRINVEKTFQEYVDRYDSSDVKVKLKIDHTYRVAQQADAIAKSLELSEEDIDLAWLLGMLHDIGRFEQLKKYHTFIDSESVNHAALSADILFERDLNKYRIVDSPITIRSFLEDDTQDELIEKAIRLHNVFKLPVGLTDRELMFANILRDADKIDILKVNCDIPLTDIMSVTQEEIDDSPIADLVYEQALDHGNVNRDAMRYPADHVVSHICFVFGLVYQYSYQEVEREGYLTQMMKFRNNIPETNQRMEDIARSVQTYMAQKLA